MDPNNNEKSDIISNSGKRILKKYIKHFYGIKYDCWYSFPPWWRCGGTSNFATGTLINKYFKYLENAWKQLDKLSFILFYDYFNKFVKNHNDERERIITRESFLVNPLTIMTSKYHMSLENNKFDLFVSNKNNWTNMAEYVLVYLNQSQKNIDFQKQVIKYIYKQIIEHGLNVYELLCKLDNSKFKNFLGTRISKILFNPYIDMALSTIKWNNSYKQCLVTNDKYSCALSTLTGASVEVGLKTVGAFGMSSGTALAGTSGGVLPGLAVVMSSYQLIKMSGSVGQNIQQMIIHAIKNYMPDDKKVDFTKDITVVHRNGTQMTFSASTIESQLIIPTQKIYEDSLVLKQYIDNKYHKAMFLLNSVDDSAEEVRNTLEFNNSIKHSIKPIPEENTNVNELFEKFHQKYFDSSSSKSNYMDGVPKIVFLNRAPQMSCGNKKSGWSFAFIIPIITIPLAGGCIIT